MGYCQDMDKSPAQNQQLQDQLQRLSMELGKEQLDVLTANKNEASEMQPADQLSRIADLEKELQLAEETAAKVRLISHERELEETTAKNQMLQEQLDVLTANKNEASEMQSDQLSRIAELEKELQLAAETAAKVDHYEQLKVNMDSGLWVAEQLDVLTANKNEASEMQSDQLSRVAELEKELQLAAETAAKVDHYEQLKTNMERELEETTAKNQMLQEQLDVLTANKNEASEMQSDQLSRVAELEKELQLAAETAAKVDHYEQLKMNMERELEETTAKNQMLQEQLDVLTANKNEASGMPSADQLSRIAELEKELQLAAETAAKVEQYQYEQLMEMERKLEETSERNEMLEEQLKASTASTAEGLKDASELQSAETLSASTRIAELEKEVEQYEQLKMDKERELEETTARSQTLQEMIILFYLGISN
eukprot:s3659_g3.t2